MKVRIEIEGASQQQIIKYTEILTVLIEKGGLDGVKGGKTIIHFDAEGTFMGIELDYWPFRRRKKQPYDEKRS